MKLNEFINQFSHNNSIWVENKENYCMAYRYNPSENYNMEDSLMDWELPHTDIAECEIIKISNVIHPHKEQAITLVIDTDKRAFEFLPELVTMNNSPLWLYERVHQTNVQVGEMN